MPQENIYQPQVAPQATAGLPQAGADAFGAQVGAGIEKLGDTLHATDIRAYKIERQLKADQEAAAVAARMATQRLENDRAIVDMRTNAAPGAAGHAEATTVMLAKQREAIGAGITEDDVRNRALARFDDYAASVGSAEYSFEVGQRVGKASTDVQHATDTTTNLLRTSTDPTVFARELKTGVQELRDMTGIPPDVRDKLIDDREQSYSLGHLNGMIDRGQAAAARALVDSGAFNGILTPEQVDRIRSGAEVEMRREAAATAHAATVEKAALADSVSTLKTLNSNGAEIPDGQLAGVQARLAALGDNSGATEIAVMRVQSGIAKETKPWTPKQFDTAINDLAGKAKRTVDQDLRLAYLRQIRGARTTQFNANPGEWAASIGRPPPALNLGDPASIDARKSWARSIAAAAGRPVPFLSANEAAELSARASSSPKERLAVANELAGFGGFDAVTAARQVAPQDAMLGILVRLRPNDRAASLSGQDARKANPALIDGTAGNDARDRFQERVGGALGLMPQGDVAAAFEVARNLYADWAVKSGAQGFDEATFGSFIHRALGGTKRTGTGEWQGGVGDHNDAQVLLPANATQNEFATVLARVNWAADDRNAPVWADGKPMTPAQIRRYVPVQRPDGRYEFRGPGNTVATVKGGGIWTLDLGKLVARMPR